MAKIVETLNEKVAEFLYGIFLWILKASAPKLKSKKSTRGVCTDHVGLGGALCSTRSHVWGGRTFHACMVKKRASDAFNPIFLPFPTQSTENSFFNFSKIGEKGSNGDILCSDSGVHFSCTKEFSLWKNQIPYVPRRSMEGRIHVAKYQDIPPPISILRKDDPNYQGTIPLELLRNEEAQDIDVHSEAEGDLDVGNQEEEQGKGKVVDDKGRGKGKVVEVEEEEEEMERCGYLATHRENGRLTIKWVTVDQPASSSTLWDETEEDLQEQGNQEEEAAAVDLSPVIETDTTAAIDPGDTVPGVIVDEAKSAVEEHGEEAAIGDLFENVTLLVSEASSSMEEINSIGNN